MCGSSRIADYLNHPAYHELVKLGQPAIPFIMDRYVKSQGEGIFDPRFWEFVLDAITGLNMIGDRGRYSPAIVREKYITWWQRESQKRRA